MKKNASFILLAILLTCCNKNDSEDKTAQLKAKFHGKYEIISSNSTDAVDLNLDGNSSTNLFAENLEITKSCLEIRIVSDNNYLFEEKWPVEYVTLLHGDVFDPTDPSSYTISYALYSNAASFQFSDDQKTIHLLGNFITPNTPNTLVSIESVTVDGDETIKVVATRKFVTKQGVLVTTTESLYKRYTTNT